MHLNLNSIKKASKINAKNHDSFRRQRKIGRLLLQLVPLILLFENSRCLVYREFNSFET